jgi:RNA polymerase sigma-54 factor
MQITQNLKLKQSQSLVMTPQLQQAIKLLQLNNLELTELVNKELEENPFLENESSEEKVEKFEEETNDLSESFESGESIADEPKIDDYDNRWDTDLSYQSYSKTTDSDSIDPGSVVEQTLSEKISLKGILKNQAELEFKSQTEKKISELLIDYIEPSGWITISIDELADFSGFDKTLIEKVLLKMQNFEPNGVFARNLKECLIIQLKNEDKLNNSKKKLIENLELLGEGNLKELQKITNLREEELKENIKSIRLLNPKPGTKYSDENSIIFNPDVIVTKNNEKKKNLKKI